MYFHVMCMEVAEEDMEVKEETVRREIEKA